MADLTKHGFARLVKHGVPPAEIGQAFETVSAVAVSNIGVIVILINNQSRQFFKLPVDQKLKSPHPPTLASGSPRRLQESYDIGSEHDELWSNIWTPAGVCDTFQPIFTSFFSVCYRAELAILEAISIGLGLSPPTLSQLHAKQSNELRLTYYPAVSRGDFAHSTRIAAHTDFGTITLLFQDSVGGLRTSYPGSFLKLLSSLIPSVMNTKCIVL